MLGRIGCCVARQARPSGGALTGPLCHLVSDWWRAADASSPSGTHLSLGFLVKLFRAAPAGTDSGGHRHQKVHGPLSASCGRCVARDMRKSHLSSHPRRQHRLAATDLARGIKVSRSLGDNVPGAAAHRRAGLRRKALTALEKRACGELWLAACGLA